MRIFVFFVGGDQLTDSIEVDWMKLMECVVVLVIY